MKWEYRVESIDGDGKYTLRESSQRPRETMHINELGKDGWELVATIADEFWYAIFKRPAA
jgi:hypothetical protein